MNQVPVEVLTEVFSYLPSRRLVAAQRVCREWSESIEISTFLWTILNLEFSRFSDLVFQQSLSLFIFNSKQSLTTISISLKRNQSSWVAETTQPLIQALKICSSTLRVLSLSSFPPEGTASDQELIEAINDCNNLKCFKLISIAFKAPKSRLYVPEEAPTSTVDSEKSSEHDGKQAKVKSRSSLTSVWVTGGVSEVKMIMSCLKGIHLTKLVIGNVNQSSSLHSILAKASLTLRFLSFFGIQKQVGYGVESYQSELSMSRVEALQWNGTPGDYYPSWLKLPNATLLLLDGELEPSAVHCFPKVSEVWMSRLDFTVLQNLQRFALDRLPLLEIIKIEKKLVLDWNQLLEMIKGRLAVEAVEVKRISKLIVSIVLLHNMLFDEFKEVVEEIQNVERSDNIYHLKKGGSRGSASESKN